MELAKNKLKKNILKSNLSEKDKLQLIEALEEKDKTNFINLILKGVGIFNTVYSLCNDD